MTGALGIVPFVSGFYLTKSPEKGLVFTLVDVLLVLSIFNAKDGKQQDESNAAIYYGLIGLNNAVDAGLAIRHVVKQRRPVASLNLLPGKGLEGRITWNF